MHAAQITVWGNPPAYAAVPDLPAPSDDQLQLRVLATAIHQLVRARATGSHYTAPSLPHLPGVDGVGEDVATGKRYYFFAMVTGSFAEVVNVPKTAVWEIPGGADPVTVAALVNPGMSGWMALSSRTTALPKDFTVAILGATSASGRLAVDVARAHGAAKVIGIARNASALDKMKLDGRVVLGAETDWSALGQVDVVLDYIYGAAANDLLAALPPYRSEVQFVQIGMVSGTTEIPLSGPLLRSKRVTLRGAGPGAWTMQEFNQEAPAIIKLVASLDRGDGIVVKKLAEAEAAWGDKSLASKRVVFVPE
jgi:NADPH:quinone reductase-like Zn-dependent oxidoreductase